MSVLAQKVYDSVINSSFNNVERIARMFGYDGKHGMPIDAYGPIRNGKFADPQEVRDAINMLDKNRPTEAAHFASVKKDINNHIGDSWNMRVYDTVESMSYSKGVMTVHVAGKAYGDGYNYEKMYSPDDVDHYHTGLKYIAYRAKQAGVRVGHKVKSIKIVGYKD